MSAPVEQDLPVTVTGEVRPGDLTPKTFQEGVVDRIVDAWKQQNDVDRRQRAAAAFWCYGFIALETFVVLGIIIARGAGLLVLEVQVLQWLLGAFSAKIVGLAWLVFRYLFSQSARLKLEELTSKVVGTIHETRSKRNSKRNI